MYLASTNEKPDFLGAYSADNLEINLDTTSASLTQSLKPYEMNIEMIMWNGKPSVDTKFHFLLTDDDAMYLLHISDLNNIRVLNNPDSDKFEDEFQDILTLGGSKYVPLKFKDKFEFKSPSNDMH